MRQKDAFLRAAVICAVLLLLVHAITSYAKQIIVDPSSGDDTTGNGTFASPVSTITAALYLAQEGDEVILNSGLHLVQPFELNYSLSFSGKSAADTILASKENDPIALLLCDSEVNISFSNISFVNASGKAPSEDAPPALQMINTANTQTQTQCELRLTNCIFRDDPRVRSSNVGWVAAQTGVTLAIDHCIFAGRGITYLPNPNAPNGTSNVSIKNSQFNNPEAEPSRAGILINATATVVMQQNNFTNWNYSVHLSGSDITATLEGNLFQGNNYGIMITLRSSKVSLSNNSYILNSIYGVYVEGSQLVIYMTREYGCGNGRNQTESPFGVYGTSTTPGLMCNDCDFDYQCNTESSTASTSTTGDSTTSSASTTTTTTGASSPTIGGSETVSTTTGLPDGSSSLNSTECSDYDGTCVGDTSTTTSGRRSTWLGDCCPSEFKCLPCPKGAVCSQGQASPARGYWRTEGPKRSEQFYECRVEAACPGCGKDNASIDCDYRAIAEGKKYCAGGHRGALCDACDDGYAKVGDVCEKCASTKSNALEILGAMAGLLTIIVLWVTQSLNSYRYAIQSSVATSDDGGRAVLEKESFRRGGMMAMMGKVVINHMHMLSFLGQLRMTRASLPLSGATRVLALLFDFASLFRLDLTVSAIVCTTSTRRSFYDRYLVYLLVPLTTAIVPVAVFATVVGVRMLILKIFAARGKPAGWSPAFSRHQRGVIFTVYAALVTAVVYVMYPTIALESFRMFRCMRIGGQLVMAGYPAEEACSGDSYDQFYRVAILSTVVFTFGFPAACLLVVDRIRKQLLRPTIDMSQRTLCARCYLVLVGYKPRRYYWEVMVLVRKVLLFAVVAFIDGEAIQTFGGLWLVQAALILHLYAQPYLPAKINKLEAVSLMVIFLTLLGTVATTSLSSSAIPVLVAIINMGALLVLGFYMLFGTATFQQFLQLRLQRLQQTAMWRRLGMRRTASPVERFTPTTEVSEGEEGSKFEAMVQEYPE